MKKTRIGLLLLSGFVVVALQATCPGGCPAMNPEFSQEMSYDDSQNMDYGPETMHQPMNMQMNHMHSLWFNLKDEFHRLKALVRHIDEQIERMRMQKQKMHASKELQEKKKQLWNSFKNHIAQGAANLKEIHKLMKQHMKEMRAKMEEPMPMARPLSQQPVSRKLVKKATTQTKHKTMPIAQVKEEVTQTEETTEQE